MKEKKNAEEDKFFGKTESKERGRELGNGATTTDNFDRMAD